MIGLNVMTEVKLDIFAALNGLRDAKDIKKKEPFSKTGAAVLKKKLIADKRANVHVNEFDKNKPYRVAVSKDKVWSNHGEFTNIDVAAAVGSLCGKFRYGPDAIKGEFDQAKAENHPEFAAWMGDERNIEIVEALLAEIAGVC